ncbi:MAG: molecular chaperone GrpE [Candidatus Woesearchaeota archaeon]|jgi:molecular chaperone GrpE
MTKKDHSHKPEEKIDVEDTTVSQEPKEKTPQEQIAELTDMLRRNQAEFENYRKRKDAQQGEFIKFAKEQLITKLIPTLDMFDLALTHKDNVKEVVTGIEMVQQQLHDILGHEGVQVVHTLNTKFDPAIAQAVSTQESDKEENTVVQEYTPAYKMHDKVIRHARVVVAKNGS